MKTFFARALGISKAILSFYLPLLRNLLSSGMSALLPLALEIVRSLTTSQITNTAKRDEAIRLLKQAAVAEGLSATESLIRFTVESAVQHLKLETAEK